MYKYIPFRHDVFNLPKHKGRINVNGIVNSISILYMKFKEKKYIYRQDIVLKHYSSFAHHEVSFCPIII